MKKFVTFLVVLAVAAGGIAGCVGSQPPAKPAALILATGTAGGTYHPYGTAMSKLFSDKIPNSSVAAQATGASIENIRLVNKRDVDLAIVQNDTLDYAYNAREMFKDKLTNVRAIAILYPEIIQIVVRADGGINGFPDIKGRKFGVGSPGSGTEANFRQLLDVHGLDYKAMSPTYLSFAEGADQFRNRLIDGFITTAGIPTPAIADIGETTPIRVVGLSEEVIAKMLAKYPFLTRFVIPANTYKGQGSPVNTLAVQATLIANATVSDEIVYNITKTLFENQADLAKAHPKGGELSLPGAVKGLSIPLHPGAERYYREKGLK